MFPKNQILGRPLILYTANLTRVFTVHVQQNADDVQFYSSCRSSEFSRWSQVIVRHYEGGTDTDVIYNRVLRNQAKTQYNTY